MTKRYIPVLAVLVCLSVAGGTAFATDEPAPAPPAAAPGPVNTSPAAPAQPTPAACVDTSRPRTRVLTSTRTVMRTHLLRGTAADTGCKPGGSLSIVSVSIALKQGSKCRFLMRTARLSRGGTCAEPRWLTATGLKRWRLEIPRRLPHGTYQILTRAVDSAGNVERAHARRLAVRQPRSTHK